jgi:Transposase, Mutator family
VRRTVPPSAEIEAQIDRLLAVGVGDNPRESLSQLARLGARLIIQRAVEDEFDAWLGRARYERRPEYQRGLRNDESGLRNGFRARRVQSAEGELEIEVPQVREAVETFGVQVALDELVEKPDPEEDPRRDAHRPDDGERQHPRVGIKTK